MNYKTFQWITVIMYLLVIYGCQEEVVRKDIDSELTELSEDQLPSLSAGIFTVQGIQWSHYSGYSNSEHGLKANEETIYHIGSISKLFIVTAIMQLEEQGLLNLDADINTYIPIHFRHPSYPEIPITTRMLLTHTAGMSKPGTFDSQKGMWNEFVPDTGPAPSEWVPEYLVKSGKHYDQFLWQPIKPGTFEIYSNIGTCVAAYIVEQISEQNFRDYCQEHIFGPLHMTQTSYYYRDLNAEQIAIMYDRQGYGSATFDNRVYPAGGAKSTVRDLSIFARCYLNKGTLNGNRILSEASIDKVFELQNPASGKCLIWNKYLGEWYGHTGGLELGASTTLSIHPKRHIGFIIFTNAHEGIINPGGEIYWLIRQKTNELM